MESKLTPEPWEFDGHHFIDAEDGTTICQFFFKDESDMKNAEANATRIVACVNACAGLDKAQIEQLAKWNQSPSSVPYFDLVAKNRILQKELDDMKAQRDALLKACKAVMGAGYGCAPSVGYMDELKQKCEAAIRITEPNYNTNK